METGEFLGEAMGHELEVRVVEFSPDGEMLATGTASSAAGRSAGESSLWNSSTGRPLAEPMRHPYPVHDLTFAPGGGRLIVGIGVTLESTVGGAPSNRPGVYESWDLETLTQVPSKGVMPGLGAFEAVLFTDDRERFLLNAGQHLLPIHLEGKEPAELRTVPQPCTLLHFDKDQRRILIAGNNRVSLYDVELQSLWANPIDHGSRVTAMDLGPGGGTLLTGGVPFTGKVALVQLWDTVTGRRIGAPMPNAETVRQVLHDPAGERVLTRDGESTRVWRRLPPIEAIDHELPITALAFAPDGDSLYVASGGGAIGRRTTTLDPTDFRIAARETVEVAYRNQIEYFAASPDGKWVMTAERRPEGTMIREGAGQSMVHLRLTAGFGLTQEAWESVDDDVVAHAFHPDGRTMALFHGRDAKKKDEAQGVWKGELWPLEQSPKRVPLSGVNERVLAADYDAGGGALIAATRDAVLRWSPPSPGTLPERFEHAGRILALRGTEVLVLDGDSARLRDAFSGEPAGPSLVNFPVAPFRSVDSVGSVIVGPNEIVTTHGLWDPTTGQRLGTLPGERQGFERVALDPSGEIVAAVGKNHTLHLWFLPDPVAGPPDRLVTWVQTITGLELGPEETLHALNADAWRAKREQLDTLGGPPTPLLSWSDRALAEAEAAPVVAVEVEAPETVRSRTPFSIILRADRPIREVELTKLWVRSKKVHEPEGNEVRISVVAEHPREHQARKQHEFALVVVGEDGVRSNLVEGSFTVRSSRFLAAEEALENGDWKEAWTPVARLVSSNYHSDEEYRELYRRILVQGLGIADAMDWREADEVAQLIEAERFYSLLEKGVRDLILGPTGPLRNQLFDEEVPQEVVDEVDSGPLGELRDQLAARVEELSALRRRIEHPELLIEESPDARRFREQIRSLARDCLPEKGFRFLRRESFACGGISNTVDIYRDAATELEFVLIPGGRMLMGSPKNEHRRKATEGPQRVVTVPAFLISRTEVTQEVWNRVMGRLPWQRTEGKDDIDWDIMKTSPARDFDPLEASFGALGPGLDRKKLIQSEINLDPRSPALGLTWEECVTFCERTRLRLPTEAEWEFACRGRTNSPYGFGAEETDLAEYAWHIGTWFSERTDYPCVVGRKKPNAFGLLDMHGNVDEYCQDAWHDTLEGGPTDGSAFEGDDASMRVCRGGSFLDHADAARSASRKRVAPDERRVTLGLRPVITFTPGQMMWAPFSHDTAEPFVDDFEDVRPELWIFNNGGLAPGSGQLFLAPTPGSHTWMVRPFETDYVTVQFSATTEEMITVSFASEPVRRSPDGQLIDPTQLGRVRLYIINIGDLGNTRTALYKGRLGETPEFLAGSPVVNSIGKSQGIKINRAMGLFEVFVDGKLAVKYRDPEPDYVPFIGFSSGTKLTRLESVMASFSQEKLWTREPLPRPKRRVFSDDFAEEGSLRRWHTLVAGDWKIPDGVLKQTVDCPLALLETNLGVTHRAGFRLSADLRLDGGFTQNDRGLGWVSAEGRIWAHYPKESSAIFVGCVLGDEWLVWRFISIPEAEWQGEDGRFHELELSLAGDRFRFEHDGELLHEQWDPRFLALPRRGKIHLWTAGSAASFDDVSFESVDYHHYEEKPAPPRSMRETPVFATTSDAATLEMWNTPLGTWTVENQALVQTQDVETGYAEMIAPLVHDRGFRFAVTTRLEENLGTCGRGIGWHLGDEHRIWAAYAHDARKLFVGALVNGEWVVAAGLTDVIEEEYSGSDGKPHRLELIVRGDTLEFRRDGELLFDKRDLRFSKLPKEGKVYVHTNRSSASFSEFELSSYSEE